MRILVVGGGGREHALVWKIAQSPLVKEVLCAPGNAGIAHLASCLTPQHSGVAGLVSLAQQKAVDLVVVGPEAELSQGLVDALEQVGIPAFGPSQAAAQLEASKGFAKEVMAEAKVPTAAYSVHDELESAMAAVELRDGRAVVKADGLAAGKGVMVCTSAAQAKDALHSLFVDKTFGQAGAKVLVEDLLVGEELSVLALCDGQRLVSLVAAQDHKAVFDGDKGANTGGMGAYAPAPLGDRELLEKVRAQVLEPTVAAMAKRGTPLRGVLYAGLMIQDGVPFVLEFNVRFGDPETQPLLYMLDEDLVPLMQACCRGELRSSGLRWKKGAAVCVVMAAGGYPGSYQKGLTISGLAEAARVEGAQVFHAGTAHGPAGDVVTSGGRVLGVTARGADVQDAKRKAYEAVAAISFDGVHYRKDISDKAIRRLENE